MNIRVKITSRCSTNKHVFAKSSNSSAKFVKTLIVPSFIITGELSLVEFSVRPLVIGFRRSLANSVMRLENHSYLREIITNEIIQEHSIELLLF